MSIRTLFLNLLAIGVLTMSLAACGDTWSGIKKDTGDNLEATGDALDKAGEDVKSE